jgi:hypothetical protein
MAHLKHEGDEKVDRRNEEQNDSELDVWYEDKLKYEEVSKLSGHANAVRQ